MGKNLSKVLSNMIYKDELTQSYFNEIKSISNTHYYQTPEILNNNIRISLIEKNFEQLPDENDQLINNNQNQDNSEINWLDYLYEYLSNEIVKKEKNNYWLKRIIENLDKEYFVTENKYLSSFFFQEFEINTKPNCISQKMRDISHQKIIGNNFNSSLNMTENLGGSFNESMSNDALNQIDEVNLKYKNFRLTVKNYIRVFKEHIFYKDHPINIVTQIFEKEWTSYAKQQIFILNKNKDNIGKEEKEIIRSLTRDIQKFIINLQICLKLFYYKTIDYSCFNEEKDELINIITSLVFRTGNIYDVMFELYSIELDDVNKNIENKLRSLIKITPEDLGINKQFCLNIVTLDYQESILNQILENYKKEDQRNDSIDYESGTRKRLKSTVSQMSTINIDNNINGDKVRNDLMEKRKINILLEIIQENKKRCPKYGEREIEDTKVNLDFIENDDMIIPKNINDTDSEDSSEENKPKLLDNNEIIGSILPTDHDNINENEKNSSPRISSANMNDDQEYLINTNKVINDYDNGPEDLNESHVIRINSNINNSIVPNVPEKFLNKVTFIRVNDNGKFISYPYETCIQLLKQIKTYKTPFEKMILIASLSSEITDCINDFWKDMKEYIKNDCLNIEAEEIMTIFIYIIIKAQIYDIAVHCKIIQSFTTFNTKSSMIGYYYSTVEAGVTYIKTLENTKELFKNKNINKVFDSK